MNVSETCERIDNGCSELTVGLDTIGSEATRENVRPMVRFPLEKSLVSKFRT